MRTKIITSLKKELLLVELPENKNTFDDLTFLNSEIDGYTLLGKLDEIKEIDLVDLVHQSIHSDLFAHYVEDIPVNTYCYKIALESFNSALESEIYWENPLANEIHAPDIEEWQEAQEKTFDKNRTLIFVKN